MKSRGLFTVSRLRRIQDRIFSVIIVAMVRLMGSGDQPPNLLGSTKLHRILNAFARLYGFDVHEILREESGQRAAWNLLRSISTYGIQTPQRLRAPVSVVWSLSYRCNLRCMHCYQNASQPSADELTIDEQLDVVDQMARAGVSLVVLSGGEPLTNPNLGRLIERIRNRGMTVSIDSNGVLLDESTVRYLKDLGVSSIELSLDSIDPKAHDQFRGLDGAFDKTLRAVELCSEAGIFTTVATTATTLNHGQSSELISLAREHGAQRVVFFDLIPAGRGREVESIVLGPSQLVNLMATVRKHCSSEEGEVFTELPQYVIYSSSRDGASISDDSNRALSCERFTVSSSFDCAGTNNVYRRFQTYIGGCPAGRFYCNIQPNGDVTPCMFMPTNPVAGNLRNESFEAIWKSLTFETLRERTNLKGKCGDCRFVMVCGGCRAKASAYENDYLASDPTCPFQAVIAPPLSDQMGPISLTRVHDRLGILRQRTSRSHHWLAVRLASEECR